jgi:hypothetical protein
MRFFTFTLLFMQVFHICASNGHGGHIKHSFLCPNGTLFQQQVCTKGKGTFCLEEYGAFLSDDIGAFNYLSGRIMTRDHLPEKIMDHFDKANGFFCQEIY